MNMSAIKKGFTLIEVVIALFLFGFCILIIARIMSQTLNGYKQFKSQSVLKQNADSVVERITREVRAAYDLDKDSCSGTRLVFYRVMKDGYKYRVTYERIKDTIERSWSRSDDPAINGNDVVANNIYDVNFIYYNVPNNPGINLIVEPVVTTKDSVNLSVKSYETSTQSKRRVIKRASSVSLTSD